MWSSSILSLAAISTVFVGQSVQDSVSTDPLTYGAGSQTPYQSFISNTQVKPPELLVTTAKEGAADGYMFIGVDGKPSSGQNVPCIYDMSLGTRMGSIVWCGLGYTEPFDFRMQMYKGEPHLTFWSGQLLTGYGHGSYYMLNASYDLVEHFSPIGFENGGDIHEFYITPNNTALVPIYTPKQADLTSVGGSSDGWILDSLFQEVDIATKQLLFQWNASTHVPINETYNPLSSTGTQSVPFDYFHINSITKDPYGDYLISARVMNTIYKISGTTGEVLWRLNGKKSDFTLTPPSANFIFQHDARWADANATKLTLFDNRDAGPSRGMLFTIDQSAKTAQLTRQFVNGAGTWAQYEGSLQSLGSNAEGGFVMGFGSQPYFTEFSKEGDVLLDAQFGVSNVVNSYRVYKFPWVGKPATRPDIAYVAAERKVYVSWHGATEVEAWAIATNSSGGWKEVVRVNRTGFETVVGLEGGLGEGVLVRARAVDKDGKALGWSDGTDGRQLYSLLVTDDGLSALSSSAVSSTLTASSSVPLAVSIVSLTVFPDSSVLTVSSTITSTVSSIVSAPISTSASATLTTTATTESQFPVTTISSSAVRIEGMKGLIVVVFIAIIGMLM